MLDPLSFTPITFDRTPPTTPARPAIRILERVSPDSTEYYMNIDYSMASQFMSCPRSFENKYIHARERISDDSATSFGDLFHRCEEIRLRHSVYDDSVRNAQETLVRAHFATFVPRPGDHRTHETMLRLLQQYAEHYRQDGWPKRIVRDTSGEPLIERPFRLPLCTVDIPAERQVFNYATLARDQTTPTLQVSRVHVCFTGKIDVVLHDDDSDILYVVDHKTSSRGGDEFFSYFHHSLQTRGYTYAAQQLLQRNVHGLLLNAVIVRPPTRTGIAMEFHRPTYIYSDDRIAEWYDDFCGIATSIVSSMSRGFFPQYGMSFKSPCSYCEYSQNCSLPRHQRVADLNADEYRDVTWSPLPQ